MSQTRHIAGQSDSPDDPAKRQKPKKTILFVEDDIQYLNEISAALTTGGFVVKQALDGQTAILFLQSVRPDLVILDLILPQRSGIDVLTSIYAEPQRVPPPLVIILTQVEEPEFVARVMSMGVATYLVKQHYDIPSIVAKVEDVLLEHTIGAHSDGSASTP